MEKQYKIALSSPDINSDVTISAVKCCNCNQIITKGTVNIRRLEIDILTGIFNSALKNEKSIKKLNQVLDVVGMLENLDKEDHIILDGSDLETFKTGFELIEKTQIWSKAKDLLKQFEAPKEIQVVEKPPVS
jgi:hypothetical protein